MITIQNISKVFDSVAALSNLSLQVEKGQFYSLLGPNGAGKTTCINIISNIVKATSGQVIIGGYDALKNANHVKKLIGVVPQEIALYEDLSAYENLKFWGKINQVKSSHLSAKIDEILKLLDLFDQRNQKISAYSGGMKRRINIAAALLHNPEVLFMDEPTVGIDPQSRLFTYEVFQKLHQQGITIFYTSHNMEEVERLSDKIGIIDHGQLIAEGSLQELKSRLNIEETLVFHLTKTPSQQFINLLSQQEINFYTDQNTLYISSGEINSELVKMVQLLDKSQMTINSIELKKVNLEMIFLKLTGNKLRE
jgi:ABC-2 type transport system ATP-binding protein